MQQNRWSVHVAISCMLSVLKIQLWIALVKVASAHIVLMGCNFKVSFNFAAEQQVIFIFLIYIY